MFPGIMKMKGQTRIRIRSIASILVALLLAIPGISTDAFAETKNHIVIITSSRSSYQQQTAETIQQQLEKANAITMLCLLYTSPSPRDRQKSRMPSSA
jgi:uncharacterized membrane protein YdfJ with MMPL/SSD domain